MLLSMMRAKLHSATVTECDLHYEGSCAIDENLLEASGMLVNEEIHIWNVNSGARDRYLCHSRRTRFGSNRCQRRCSPPFCKGG